MFDMDIVWEAPLPPGPKIIAPNHPSTTDPFLVTGLISEPTTILIDNRLFKVPVFGRYLHLAGHVPVDKDNGRKAFEAARRLLDEGRTIAIFPEGAVSPFGGGLHRPRTGAARLALLTGAPIIPIGIHLDRERIKLVESKYSGITVVGTWYLRGPYAMTIGSPLILDGNVEDREYVRAVSERLMRRIARLSRQSARRMAGVPNLQPRLETGPLGLPGQV
jgi:1-acyl-sn-glycerol-3-phosphate acyltransferase